MSTSVHSPSDNPAPLPGGICSQCQCCPAQKGFHLCFFCEDNEPCPNSQRKVAGKTVFKDATQKGRPVSSKAQVVPLQHRDSSISGVVSGAGNGTKAKLSTEGPSRISTSRPGRTPGAITAEGGQSRPAASRPANPAAPAPLISGRFAKPSAPIQLKGTPLPMETEKICGHPGCGKKLKKHNRSGFCSIHFYLSARNPIQRPTVCVVEGCVGALGPNNKSGRCARHARNFSRNKLRESAASEPSSAALPAASPEPSPEMPPVAIAPSTPPALPISNGHHHSPRLDNCVTCVVSEYSMDLIWTRLTAKEKAALLFRSEGNDIEVNHA